MIQRILMLLLTVMVNIAHAQIGAESVKQRAMLEAVSYRAISEISLYSIHEDDPNVFNRIERLLRDGNAHAQAIVDVWPDVAQTWVDVHQFMVTSLPYEVRRAGNYSGRLSEVAALIHKTFDNNRPSLNALSDQHRIEIELLVSLEKMLAGYFRYNNSQFGSSSRIVVIDEESVLFEQRLSALRSQGIRQELERGWGFMRSTLLAYNERSAVYIVERTSSRMRVSLLNSLYN